MVKDTDNYRYSFGNKNMEMDLINMEANEEAAQDYIRIMPGEEQL